MLPLCDVASDSTSHAGVVQVLGCIGEARKSVVMTGGFRSKWLKIARGMAHPRLRPGARGGRPESVGLGMAMAAGLAPLQRRRREHVYGSLPGHSL